MLRHAWMHVHMEFVIRCFPSVLTVHNGFPNPGAPSNRLLDLSPKRVIIARSTPDAVSYFQRRRPSLTISWVAHQLERAHALVFVSPQNRDAWSAIANIAHLPQAILPNTCREDDAERILRVSRRTLRTALQLPQRAFIAACVGYVQPVKGQDTIVKALPDMVRSVPELLVVFVGSDNQEWAAELKHTIQKLGLAGHVRFVGVQREPYAFIRAADLLIHPARAEAHGISILEAMLLGTPVLASNVGGIPSSVTHGETGWLIPPDDPAALLHGFRRLAGCQELRDQLATRAEAAYWNGFSRRMYRERFHAIFQELLPRPASPSSSDSSVLRPPPSFDVNRQRQSRALEAHRS
jgi:glycosyltransferase involved in cell wall biosynthesis